MPVYAIGDVQGCYGPLRRLLDVVNFDPAEDRLWFTGDLVNRGPDSLAVLRFVRSLGETAVTVLGNHDLHLLAVGAGAAGTRRRDTLDGVLAAPDRDDLLRWLCWRPLAHHDTESGFLMVHAGVPPQWDLRLTLACAAELEAVLRDEEARPRFLGGMYGDEPARWDEALAPPGRLRFIVNCLTRLRYCASDGTLDLEAKGSPGTQPDHLVPWFRAPRRATAGIPIVFGHWSTLGVVDDRDVHPLDSGCVWGRALTALRLDDGERIAVGCG